VSEVKYLRNADGQISMMPLIGWHVENFGYGMMTQLQFAETPEDLEQGILGVVQLAVSAEQALKLSEQLNTHARKILATQKDSRPQ
jgi:hypothetical protein